MVADHGGPRPLHTPPRDAPAPAGRLITLANMIGFARLMLAPVVAWLIWRGSFDAACWLFLLGGLSDAADGFVARRLGTVTRFGQILDPVADKVFMNTAYIMLAVTGLVPLWLAGLVLARDLLIVVAAVLSRLFGLAVPIEPLWAGKINTACQVAFGTAVLAGAGYGWPTGDLLMPLFGLVIATTVISGGLYLERWLRAVFR